MSVPSDGRRGRRLPVGLALAVAAAASLLVPVLAGAQSPVDEVRPAPPSIGADVPLTCFAPPGSSD
jgi:hypothetical protein